MSVDRIGQTIFVCIGLAAASASAFAASWPVKPIRLIVPFAPGGAVDVTARTISQRVSTRIGQQIVVENRGGAGGNVGTEAAAKSPPDGYTLLAATVGQIAVNPHLYAKLPFDPLKDLAPITLTAHALNVLCVHPSLPAKSVKELVALAKSRPNALNFMTGGVGASDHIAAQLFMSLTSVKMNHVPYKGGAPAMVDLIGGNVELGFATVATAMGPIKSGRLRALGVTSAKRFELLPEVPTVAEAGVPTYEFVAWHGLFAPAGTPSEILKRLSSEVAAVANLDDVRQRLTQAGILATSNTPDTFATYIRSEYERWGRVVKAAAIKLE